MKEKTTVTKEEEMFIHYLSECCKEAVEENNMSILANSIGYAQCLTDLGYFTNEQHLVALKVIKDAIVCIRY